MSKTTKKILIFVVVVLVLFGIILIVYNTINPKPVETSDTSANILDDLNQGLGNLIATIEQEENKIIAEDNQNEETNNIENKEVSNTNTQSSTQEDDNQYDLDTTAGEKKALELAKAEWKEKRGNLDEVSFNNVMVQGDGKYVVSVNDSKTTTVIKFYVVDVVTGLIEER